MTQPPYDPNQPSEQSGQQPDASQWGQPTGQPGYQQQYQQPAPAYGYVVPDHPKATTAMVLGILGIVVCGVIAPFAWSIGKKTRDEIDASGGRLGGRGQANAGYIMGIIGTVLLGLGVLFAIVYVILIVAILGGTAASNASGIIVG
jgi:hypothetical protein